MPGFNKHAKLLKRTAQQHYGVITKTHLLDHGVLLGRPLLNRLDKQRLELLLVIVARDVAHRQAQRRHRKVGGLELGVLLLCRALALEPVSRAIVSMWAMSGCERWVV